MAERPGFWTACERLIGPAAVDLRWRQLAGDDYDAAKAFLRPMQELATGYPCTRSYSCGCDHRVIIHDDDDIVAVCACNPQMCENIPITKSDIIIYELDRRKLHLTIAETLSLEPTEVEVPYARYTTQVGFCSPRPGARFPVFLTIQVESERYRNVAFALAASNAEPFILIAPTLNLFPPDCLDILRAKKAALFTLWDILTVDGGKVSASPSCKAMLARFCERATGMRKALLSLNDVFFYSRDFRSVSIYDQDFTLTPSQAEIIEVLCRAYRNGTPDVGKEYILERLGSRCERLRDYFSKDLKAFKSLIRPGKKRGTYCLNI